jgi:hypothetical protein
LEEYPLEAKINLAWTGGETPICSQNHALAFFKTKRLDLKSYQWNTVAIETLRRMRTLAEDKGWLSRDIQNTVAVMEYYFYFSGRAYRSGNVIIHDHWNQTSPSVGFTEDFPYVSVNGEQVRIFMMGNVNFNFDYHLRTGKGLGICVDEADFINALCKSWGISTTYVWRINEGPKHAFTTYYDPETRAWKSYSGHLQSPDRYETVDVYIFKPPVNLRSYVPDPANVVLVLDNRIAVDSAKSSCYFVTSRNLSRNDFTSLLTEGIPTSHFRELLFSSQ